MGKEVSFDISAKDKASPEIEKVERKVDGLAAKLDLLAGKRIDIGFDADTSGLLTKLNEVKAKLGEIDGRKVKFQIEATGIAAVRTELSTLRTDLDRIDGRRVKFQVEAAGAAGVRTELSTLSTSIGRLDGRVVKVRVDLDAAAALAALRELETRIAALSGSRVDIRVDADTAAALAALTELSARIERIDGQGVNVRAQVDLAAALAQIATLQAQLQRVNGNTAHARVDVDTGSAMAKIAAVGLALSAIAPAAAFLAAGIATIGIAGAGAFGVLAGSLSGVSDAVSALGEGSESTSSSMKSNASAVKTAVEGVATAQRAVRDAQESLTEAVGDAKDAQDDLNNVRKEALRDLKDLADQTEEMSLREEGASISVARSRERLNEVNKDSKSTALDRREAENNLNEALLRQKQTHQDAIDLTKKKTEEDKKGVEGSDKVQAAWDRIKDANNRVAKAQQTVSDRAGDVTKAQERVREASQQAGAAGSSSMSTLQKAMAALTPEGRKFAVFLRGVVSGPLKEIRDAGQRNLLPGLQAGIASMLPYTHQLSASFGTIAKNMGEMFAKLGPHLGPAIMQLARLAAIASNKGFSDLGAALGRIIDKFTVWASGQTTASINQGLQRVEDVLRKIGTALQIVWQGFQFLVAHAKEISIVSGAMLVLRGAIIAVNLAMSANPISLIIGALALLGLGLYQLYQKSETFRKAVDELWKKLKDGFQQVWSYLKPKLDELWKTIQNELVPALKDFAKAMEPIVSFLVQKMKPIFKQVWDAIFAIVKGTITAVSGIINIVTGIISGDWSKVWKGIQQVFGGVWTAIKGILDSTLNIIRGIFGGFCTWVKSIWNAAWDSVKNKINDVITGIKNIIKSGFDWISNSVFTPFKDGVATIGKAFETVKSKINSVVDGIKSLINSGFTWISNSVFTPFKTGVASLGTAFETAKNAITTAWSKIKEATAAPIRFVINTVIHGIASKFNDLASKVGMGRPLDEAPAVFAAGGEVPARLGTKGKDSVAALLMPDEHVWTTDEVSGAGGHASVERLRALAAAGQIDLSGDPGTATVRGYATGGAVTPAQMARVNAVKAWIPSVDPLPYVWGGVGPSGYDCIAAGVLITTDRGDVPIEQVTTDDQVLTRAGWRRILRAWKVRDNAETVTVQVNGESLTGTPDHRVWTENRGWAPLGELTIDDTVVSCQKQQSLGSFEDSKASPTTFTRIQPRLRTETTSSARGDYFTASSGSQSTAQFLPGTRSTTTTTTRSTTSQATSSASPSPTTELSQPQLDNFTTSSARSAAPSSEPSATDGLLGASAPCSTRPSSTTTPGRLPHPRQHLDGPPSSSAPCVAPSSSEPCEPEVRTASALPTTSGSSTTQRHDVYDLTVEGEHEFFAAGVLVHNCSGLVGEVWARLTGHSSYRRYMTTNTILDSPGSLGLAPGPGLFSIGVSRTHTDGNLAGLGFEAASTASGIKIGGAAKPYGAFPSVYHLADFGTAGAGIAGASANGTAESSGGFFDAIGRIKDLFTSGMNAVSGGWWSKVAGLGGGAFGQAGTGIGKKAITTAAGAIPAFFKGIAQKIFSPFDSGGMLQPGLNLAYNGTGRPEPVLTSSQWDGVSRTAGLNRGGGGGTAGGTTEVHIHLSGFAIGNETQMVKQIKQALAGAAGTGLKFA
jgi:phage-related protein